MNSPNLTTVPLPPAKGRSIGRIRADQPLEACLRKSGAASKLGKIQGPQMRRIHRPLRGAMQGLPERVFAPQRWLDSIGPVLRGCPVLRGSWRIIYVLIQTVFFFHTPQLRVLPKLQVRFFPKP